MKSFAVIGLGRFGYRLACQLYELGSDVLCIDADQEKVDRIADHVTQAVVADATNKEVLENLGVGDCDCAIVGTASDLSASVLITMALKMMGVPQVICKAHDETHMAILEKLGADRVFIPEYSSANKLANSLMFPNIMDSIGLSDQMAIQETSPLQEWCGKALKELNIRAKYKVTVIAIRRGSGEVIASPGADDVIHEGDSVVLLGSYEAFAKMEKMFGKK